MKKFNLSSVFFVILAVIGCSEKKSEVIHPGLNNLDMMSDAETPSISYENLIDYILDNL